MNMSAFFKLHQGLPREGPGSDAATLRAVQRLPKLPPSARVLDIGCGPGAQTLVLARELGVPIIAIDFHEPFLEQLRASAKSAGLEHRITTKHADMESLDLQPESVDLIWAEGSIYIIGFYAGLTLWRRFVKTGGLLVASELTWLTDSPPAEALEFWSQGYPPMTHIAGNLTHATAAGYEVFDHFALPAADWWPQYLTPLEQASKRLRAGQGNVDLTAVLDETEREIDICRRFGEHFSYVFYLMRKTDAAPQGGCSHGTH